MPLPPVSLEITTAACKIQVRGKRSTKGWTILEVNGASAIPLGHIKAKEKAIQFAEDACEPGVATTFLVRPSA